jgi:acyl-CoA synthetase (AMP-forming)/AMP-acid ligase II/aryl carrier-like protein
MEWEPVPYVGADVVAAVISRVGTNPDLTAIVASSGERITYRQLLERAALAAPELSAADEGQGVAVRSGHGVDGAVAVLGAAIAGVRLALVDLGDPVERRDALLDLMGLPVLDADGFPTRGDARLDEIRSGVPDVMAATSGSTSAPKIAVLPVNRWASEIEGVDRVHRRTQLMVAGVGSYAYLSLVCASLTAGGTGVLFDPHAGSTADLERLLRSEKVTFFGVTPTLVQSLARAGGALPDLTLLRLRGERVTSADLAAAHELAPNAVIRHLYASTEAGHIASYLWRPGDPIGDGVLPLRDIPAECDLATVDAGGRVLAGVGPEPGELVVRTASMVTGYVGGTTDDDLFVADGDRRWMRTGDLAVADPDGGIRVLGRVGRRVKIAGMFVDLDEVAVSFEREDEVAQAAVTSFDDGRQLRLVAHLVEADGRVIDPIAIRARLAARHPVHMVPSLVRVLDDPPRNAAGKIDHLELGRWRPAAPDAEAVGGIAGPIEAMIITTAGMLLGRPVHLDTDLITAGFTSLDWVELVEHLRHTGVEIALAQCFAAPTPRGIARSITGEVADLVAISHGSREPALFWAVLGVNAERGVPLARALTDRTMYVSNPKGFGRSGERAWTVRRIVRDMADAIDGSLGGSPLVVVGFSTGCHFATGVAAELVERGREVPLLVLLDPVPNQTPLRRVIRRELDYLRARIRLRTVTLSLEELHHTLFRVHVRQVRRDRHPAKFAGPVLLVRSDDHRHTPVPDGLTGPIRVERISGDHFAVASNGEVIAGWIEDMLGNS